MSQYGNSPKNPPWVRSGQNMGVAQTSAAVTQSLMAANPLQTGMLQYPQVFQGQQMYGAVSYPTRALNTAAFQQGQQQGGGSQPDNKQQRLFTGTVTKVQDNFGFVDEDVFFQSSCCIKGFSPKVGDRVLVEAVYNANMPFKWNATRIQVISMQDQRSGQNYGRSQSNYNAVPPPKVNSGNPNASRFSSGGSRFSNASGDRGGRSGGGGGGSGGGGGGNMRRDEPDSRKRRRDDRDNFSSRDDKAKSPPRKRSKSPNRQARRPRRPVPRYSVTVPKTNLNTAEGDVVEVKKRYPNMYIPSDFFLSKFQWTQTFPVGKPLSLDFPCSFHVMHKDVDNIVENNAVLEPPDADYLYTAKVMLMASPGLEELYSKCIVMAEDREGSRSTIDEDSLSHPSRLIHFLVGTRGKENMAIGGPWSPSLDGNNPNEDPGVLVKTAIRTTKALTGIDLSNCTQWFRFMEVLYHRGESVHRGKSYPARVETVVIFVPDVWSCVPTRLEWDGLQLSYQKALSRKINDHDQKEEEEEVIEKESPSEQSPDKPKREPKHHSELDPKNMKVSDLREELEARSLSSKGLKSQLVARLVKVLKSEEEEEAKQKAAAAEEASGGAKKDVKENKDKKDEQKEKDQKEDDKKKKEEEEPKKLDEKEKQILEKRYKLPKKPSILVHPNRTAKSGKFDCHYYSLSVLLGYRQDDTKEHSFEVSVFAELFNEMLMRDFGFNIYRAIIEAPERAKEEKKEEKEKPKDEKEKPKDEKEKEKPKDEKEKLKEEDKDKENNKDKDAVKDSKEDNKEPVDSKEKPEKTKEEEIEIHSDAEEMDEDDKESRENKENDKDKKSDKEPRRERAKLVTMDKELLLSFNFFDTTRCGYIYDKDIEDLLFSLGLTLSRSQVRKLVSKVVSRDAVYYRRLTDRPEGTTLPEHLSTAQLLAFKPALPYSQENTSQNGGMGQENNEVKSGQMIVFNGTLVDVGKLMEQLARSESARIDTEKTLGKLRDELSKLKEASSKSEKYIKDLNTDVREYRDRLSHTSSELSALQAKERQFMRTLNEISEKIRPLIAKPEPKPEPEIKEIIVLDEKGEEPMAVEEEK